MRCSTTSLTTHYHSHPAAQYVKNRGKMKRVWRILPSGWDWDMAVVEIVAGTVACNVCSPLAVANFRVPTPLAGLAACTLAGHSSSSIRRRRRQHSLELGRKLCRMARVMPGTALGLHVNWADGNESPGQIAALNEPQFSGISALLAANSGKNRLALKSW